MNKKVLNQLLFIFASWLFLPINTFGFFSDFFSSSDIPKGWITQKSPGPARASILPSELFPVLA